MTEPLSDPERAPRLNAAALAAADRRDRLAERLLSLPALLLVLLLVVAPMAWLFSLSFVDAGEPSLVHYRRMWENPSYREVFRLTLVASGIVTALCIVLGYPVAYLLSRLPPRIRAVLMIAVLMPFWTSVLVRTYAWLVLLQRRGLINTWLVDLGIVAEPLSLVNNLTGTVIGMLHIMLPFMILPLYGAMRAIDLSLVQAAQSMGASPTYAFWKVFFPLSVPGLTAGTVITFILCLGFYVTPELLGGGRVVTVPMRIRENTSTYMDWGAASSLGVVLLALTIAILALGARLVSAERLMSVRS